jgi:hypothetical protein
MLPCTLEMRIEDEVLAKAFWIIAIMMRPGARNSANGTPPTSSTARPSASVKMARNRSVVTAGAATVWVKTFRNRRTSLAQRVHTPSQFTTPMGWGSIRIAASQQR